MGLAAVTCPGCGGAKKSGVSKSGEQRFCAEKRRCKAFVGNCACNACKHPLAHIFFNSQWKRGSRAAKGAAAGAPGGMEGLSRHVNRGGSMVGLVSANDAEMDKMRSFAGKSHRRRLWRAAGHTAGGHLALHFGARGCESLDKPPASLAPFDIKTVYSGNNFACQPRAAEREAATGEESAQKIERRRPPLRRR